jgi:ubiquinone/menaquinone biosynthesis C-methylase UbiE
MSIRIPCSPAVSFRSFGYIPSGEVRRDLRGRLFGFPNITKRLQARAIMEALALRPEHRALDFGCGLGFMTVEMAKVAARAIGIDVNPYIDQIPVPPALVGRLQYVRTEGEHLPFDDASFDRVLASEVLPMTGDPQTFLGQIRRVLRPGGRLVVSNGAGHPAIRDAFRRQGPILRWLARRYPQRMPRDYADYCARLQTSFGTSQSRFFDATELTAMVQTAGFRVDHVSHTPGHLAGAWISWRQFLLYLRTGSTVSHTNFVANFAFLSLLSAASRRGYEGGVLLCATR